VSLNISDGFIDKTGKEVIPPALDLAYDAINELIVAAKRDKTGLYGYKYGFDRPERKSCNSIEL
jgi:hypothetical protein